MHNLLSPNWLCLDDNAQGVQTSFQLEALLEALEFVEVIN